MSWTTGRKIKVISFIASIAIAYYLIKVGQYTPATLFKDVASTLLWAFAGVWAIPMVFKIMERFVK